MNMAPRYLLTDKFDLGMLASLTADITLTEISLDDVCDLTADWYGGGYDRRRWGR
jgi:hypothetical protein